MKRLQYMLTRVAQGLIALMLIATVNFLLVRAAPGDPVAVLAGEAGRWLSRSRVRGLDAILGGHTHDGVPRPVPLSPRMRMIVLSRSFCSSSFATSLPMSLSV